MATGISNTRDGEQSLNARRPRRLLFCYIVATLLATLAFLLRYFLAGWIGDVKAPFVTFYAAILLATLYGGSGPGLLCLILSVFGSLYFLSPAHQFVLPTGTNLVILFSFICVSAMILFVVNAQHRAKERADANAAEAQQRQQQIEALQVQLEKRLKEAERQAHLMETLLEQVPTGISIADPPDVRIRKESRYGELISGFGAEELEGKPQEQVRGIIYHADGVTPARDEELPLTRATLNGELVQDEEWVIAHHKTGKKIVVLCNAAPVRDEEGNIISGILAWRDITVLKAAQAEIIHLNERLHRAVYEASHRIKNQLQVLAATADMVMMEHDETIPADDVRRLRSQIAAIAVTHDLLTRETRIEGTTDHISIRALMQQILGSLQQTTDRHTLRFSLDDASVPIKTATSIALITNERVSNAIKHGSGDVEVMLRIDETQMHMEICDDGPGFPPDFDPIRSANTGIELLLALAQTDLLGTVEFTNRPSGGARILIVCPITV